MADVRCPTLIAHGTAGGDDLFSRAEAACRLIPNGQLHRMENARTLPWVDIGAGEMLLIRAGSATAHVGDRARSVEGGG